jgi:hypothetical protein
LGVVGQFDEHFESKVTSLLQSYVEEHRDDDLLEVCITLSAVLMWVNPLVDYTYDVDTLPMSLSFSHRSQGIDTSGLPQVPRISPIPTSFSVPREQPQTPKLVDDIPTQPIGDQPNPKLWLPSQADLGPISWGSSTLFLRVAERTETNIAMKDRGLQVSAPDMVNVDKAMRKLTSLEKCFVWS